MSPNEDLNICSLLSFKTLQQEPTYVVQVGNQAMCVSASCCWYLTHLRAAVAVGL